MFLQATDVGIIIIILYVDNMIIIKNNISKIQNLQTFINQNFKMKHLSRLKVYFYYFFLHLGIYLLAEKNSMIKWKQNLN